MTELEQFQRGVKEKIIDPAGTHHLLVGGFHGQKADYEKLADDDPTYLLGIELASERICEMAPGDVVLAGVANGGNRVARDISERINTADVKFLDTVKFGDRIRFSKQSLQYLRSKVISKLVVVDDVAKSGASILQVIRHSWDRGEVSQVYGFSMIQRRENVSKLDELSIAYDSLVKIIMPDYSPRDCAQIGFCRDGWELI